MLAAAGASLTLPDNEIANQNVKWKASLAEGPTQVAAAAVSSEYCYVQTMQPMFTKAFACVASKSGGLGLEATLLQVELRFVRHILRLTGHSC